MSTLLWLHGIAELVAGIAMIFITEAVFPFTSNASAEVQFLGKSFGVAIAALGITGLVSNKNHTFGTFFGAFSYHALIASLLAYQAINAISSDIQATFTATAVHTIFAAAFLRAVLNYNNQVTTAVVKKNK